MSQKPSQISPPVSFISVATLAAYSNSVLAAETLSQDSVISIIVAAISGGALVTSLWALLLGRKSMQKDREFVATLKQNIARDRRNIDKSLHAIEKSEARAEKIIGRLVQQNNSLLSKQHQAWLTAEKLQGLAERSESIESQLQQRSDAFEQSIDQSQDDWNLRLNKTKNTVSRVEQELRDGLNHLDMGIKRVQQQDAHSYQLAQQITTQHNLQLHTLEANNELTEQVRTQLNATLEESTELLKSLRDNQAKADNAYEKYMESMSNYENELYTEYDSAFQSADMARQELNANIDESRLHIESLRRYEEQSRVIKEKTENNLQQLDVKSINQLSNTLETTQETFQSLSKKVAEAQQALNSLNKAELSQASKAEHKDGDTSYYQEAIGENNLVPFFSSRKNKEIKH